jgi:hypothetical protein
MPKTPIKTFLVLIHKLNRDMDAIATSGETLLRKISEIDFTSVADPMKEEELNAAFEETGEQFRKLHDMKETLMGGLQRKVIEKMNSAPMSANAKSASFRRSSSRSRSSRRTMKAKSI